MVWLFELRSKETVMGTSAKYKYNGKKGGTYRTTTKFSFVNESGHVMSLVTYFTAQKQLTGGDDLIRSTGCAHWYV